RELFEIPDPGRMIKARGREPLAVRRIAKRVDHIAESSEGAALAGRGIPHSHRAISRGAGDLRAVRRDAHAEDLMVVAVQHRMSACPQIEDADEPVLARGD